MKILTISTTSLILFLAPLMANPVVSGNISTSAPNSIGGKTLTIHGSISSVQEILVYDKTNQLMGRIVSFRQGHAEVTTFYRGVSELVLTTKHITTTNDNQVNEIYTPDGKLVVRSTIPEDHKKAPKIQDGSGQDISAEIGQKLMLFPNKLIVASLAPDVQISPNQ